MNAAALTLLQDLWNNLRAGLLLACLRKNAIGQFRPAADQIAALLICNLLIILVSDYLRYGAAGQFNPYAFNAIATLFLGSVGLSYIAGRNSGNVRSIVGSSVMLLSLSAVFSAVGNLLVPEFDLSWWNIEDNLILVPYLLWIASVIVFAFHGWHGGLQAAALALLYLALLLAPPNLLPSGAFWYVDDFAADNAPAGDINQEAVYYSQPYLMNEVEDGLLPGRPRLTDAYFVGFAGDAAQDVFMKEVNFARRLFDNRFHTGGRSVSLVNNATTVGRLPIASFSNLDRVLHDVARAMNPQEDILFLYLTSHGSEQHELAVNFWPLTLNQVTPQALRAALDDAGIKWRVLLISACYSGGFIAPLADDSTLILTAADADNTSFGCGSIDDFTYFGKAVLEEQLTQNQQFIAALRNAITAIGERERREHVHPSNPQLSVGAAIEEKLRQFDRENGS